MSELKSNKLLSESQNNINVSNIPMCSHCLFEIEKGENICGDCNLNLCNLHLIKHNENFNNHNIYKLKLKE